MLLKTTMMVRTAANIFGFVAVRFVSKSSHGQNGSKHNQNNQWGKFKKIIKYIHASLISNYRPKYQPSCAAKLRGPVPIGGDRGQALWGISASIALLFGTPALSQSVEVVETLDNYQIMRVVQSKVCFAVYNGKSADGSDVTFATYKTKDGDRWQVVGYVDDNKTAATKGDLLTIRFDDKPALSRAVDFSRGDFALPFTEDKDLQGFDTGVANAANLSFHLKNLNDTITLDLVGLRTAKTGVDSCLEGIQ